MVHRVDGIELLRALPRSEEQELVLDHRTAQRESGYKVLFEGFLFGLGCEVVRRVGVFITKEGVGAAMPCVTAAAGDDIDGAAGGEAAESACDGGDER